MKMVILTPCVTRILSCELRNIEGKERLRIKDDNVIVFNRPKFWVGSGGTVWASEFMQIRHTESLHFTAEPNENLELN